MSERLPIAGGPEVRRDAAALVRRHRGSLAVVLGLNALAAVAGLVGPWVMGQLVEAVKEGTTTGYVDRLIALLAASVLAQTVLTWFARRAAFVLSETVFAQLRENFMRQVLALPLSVVERAGTGDLVSRTTADVDTLARTVRFAIPETLISAVTILLTVVAAVVVSPVAALSCIVGLPAILIGMRWYLRRAPAGYLWERAAYATMTGTIGETVDGGRTVDALSLGRQRIQRIDADLADAYRAERRTLYLRTILFPTVEVAYVLPVAVALIWGGWLVSAGHASIGEVTAVALYVQQLADPVDRLISWLDEIQVGATSFARLVGVTQVPDDRAATGEEPEHERLSATDVRYAYVPDRDVLHGLDLDLEPGERIAVVGPSGAGKSTLGRLLAGIHPPRTGRVEVGDVRLVDLELETLRREVALVTQEQHVFVGTVADNLRLARLDASDDDLWAALEAVDALPWAEVLPHGLETVVGAGGHPLSPPQQQQVALARLVLADPHTLVLDEATSLLDPRAARHLERSLASVLDGRTVVAIAHRLQTAHDADRVAVVEGGRLTELGTHDELVEHDGSYAALWESWHGTAGARPPVTMTPPEPAFRPLVMDRPVLHSFVRELLALERLQAFAAALPSRARVSEPVLPLLLATLHEQLERGLVVLLPEDADARDVAEAAGWFVGAERVALLPGRGVRWGSGLEPPPHLVGERARALDVLAGGGLVAASATALAEGVPPPSARPEPLQLEVGSEPGLDGLAEHFALAGYERVERAEERGQFAVRGGLVDVFPTTGREPLRVELYGDEIEQVRAFSPFTQRALHPVDGAVIYPAAERLSVTVTLSPDEWDEAVAAEVPDDLVPVLERPPDFVWQPEEVRRVWAEEGLDAISLKGASELDPFPQAQPFSFEAQRPAIAARGLAEAENELNGFVNGGNRVVVAFPHAGEALRTDNLLKRADARILDPGDDLPEQPELLFAVAPARRGFVWRELGLVLLPDTQVFRKRPPRADKRLGRALASFADLRSGDFIVHEDHGVGKLLGFETKEVAGVTRDYLFLAFRGEDRLYVPHEQLGKVSKYIGADAGAPSLSKLGGKAWQNLKARARESVRELATELIALYAQRQQAPGTAYELENEWLERLETEFPYRETEDQARAIEAVKEDLEAPRPMDRLVCGDVGFGKTEVAVRAAFAAAVNGKQTLVLCPTTILAEQHWNTFKARYRDFPVQVEMVSRFRKPAETKQILRDFAEGKIEVLVGTHRVLSRDVIPKDLGLVILDEEQRFGVAQKELLRSLRLEVDVLALSATPIPRTLHMSLSGLRDISIIETPPEGRRPIRTTVGEYDEELVKAALEREIERGGQAFYLHNRVETIEEAAEKVQQLCPGIRFIVAHGQMRERELEEKMHAFLRGDADVLVSTTIIESGIDIPQANTLIVERADVLGLSQLYQIRGRVGRSDVTAHAYLLYPDAMELSPEARARLSTLADHTELGAGFQIAMRDLEIRGAGDLLGAEQSGHVAALGFELYVEMLAEAVAELQGQRRLATRPVRVDARVDAYVPATYVASEALKIDIHRRLALAESDDELRELHAALEDRYGPVPEPVEHLFAIQEAKLKLARLGADYLVYRGGRATVGPLVLGSAELRALRDVSETAVYTSAKREVSRRTDELEGAIELVDAIVVARQAA